MELADAKRLKALEKENAELKKMLAESMLENRVPKYTTVRVDSRVVLLSIGLLRCV